MLYRCPQGCEINSGMSHGHPGPCDVHGEPFKYVKALQRREPMQRGNGQVSGVRRRGSTLKRRRGFAASPAQRAKVDGLACLVCGREKSDYVAIDPAHLWPRGAGGCNDALCVGPLCRDSSGGCHRLFDNGELDILPALITHGYFAEIAHITEAHRVSPTLVVERLTGKKWAPVEVAA